LRLDERFRIVVYNGHLPAVGSEALGGRPADALRAAGDERRLRCG